MCSPGCSGSSHLVLKICCTKIGSTWRHHVTTSRDVTESRDGIPWRHYVTASRDGITRRHHATTSRDVTASRDGITRRHHATASRKAFSIVWTVHLSRVGYIGHLVYLGFSVVFPTACACKTMHLSSMMTVNSSWSGSVMAVVRHWLRDDTKYVIPGRIRYVTLGTRLDPSHTLSTPTC